MSEELNAGRSSKSVCKGIAATTVKQAVVRESAGQRGNLDRVAPIGDGDQIILFWLKTGTNMSEEGGAIPGARATGDVSES